MFLLLWTSRTRTISCCCFSSRKCPTHFSDHVPQLMCEEGEQFYDHVFLKWRWSEQQLDQLKVVQGAWGTRVYRAGQRSSGGQIKAWTTPCKSWNQRKGFMLEMSPEHERSTLSCGQSTGPPGQVLVSFHRNITCTHCPALDCFSVSKTSVTLSLTRSSALILQTSLSSVSVFTVRNTCSALWPSSSSAGPGDTTISIVIAI